MMMCPFFVAQSQDRNLDSLRLDFDTRDSSNTALAGDSLLKRSADLYLSKKNNFRYEIGRIEVFGNKKFPDELLLSYVSQNPTATGILEDIIILYKEMVDENGHVGPYYEKQFNSTFQKLDIDFGYHSVERTKQDSLSLLTFFELMGHHEATVRTYFFPDTIAEENVLLFYVEEGTQYKIDTLVYQNLSLVDTAVREMVAKTRIPLTGKDFTEELVLGEILKTKSTIQNNGYYSLDVQLPDVHKNIIEKSDSIVVRMDPGKRVRFGNIEIEHNLNGRRSVSDKLVYDMLEFKEGEYYCLSKRTASENNLMSLNTFSITSIDTFGVDDPFNDTILPFKVQLNYKDQNESGFNLSLLQKEEGYEFLNIRSGINYTNKNLFNAAQRIETSITLDIRDIQRYINSNFSNDAFEFEGQIQFFNYFQPLFFRLGENRVGLNTIFNFSQRNAGNVFEVQTWYFDFKLPVDFQNDYWLNNFTAQIALEKQLPKRFQSSDERQQDFRFNFDYFETASDFNEQNAFAPTASVLTLSGYHDTRNDLFDPTSGWQFSSLADITPPSESLSLAQFLRLQVSSNNFFDIGWGTVLATKLRIGHIFLFDFEDNNQYISTGRQFFAGGPNSNRGWVQRRLRAEDFSIQELGLDENPDNLDDYNPQQVYEFYKDFLGNTSIVETSLELRYRFHAIKNLPPAYSEILKSLGAVLFADIGNSYGWLVQQNTSREPINLDYILSNLAVSTGVGLRYFTPLGPVRIDFGLPILGPIAPGIDRISQTSPLEHIQFNLGLQHAF
ncbi:MAG: hypothetical protein Kapaf2KO_23210 [Candidatus Kapaibacteriales bacterium]